MSAPQLIFTENCSVVLSILGCGDGVVQRIKGLSYACTGKASSLTFGTRWVDSKCLLSHGVLKKLNTERHSEDLRNHLGRQGGIV